MSTFANVPYQPVRRLTRITPPDPAAPVRGGAASSQGIPSRGSTVSGRDALPRRAMTPVPNNASTGDTAPRRSGPPRRTAAEAACLSATAIATEIARDRRADHLARYARTLNRALAALGVAVTPVTPTVIPTNAILPTNSPISPREHQILIGISQGKTNADIGRELFITEDTVKTHTRRVYRKLNAHDRAHAATLAMRQGLIT